MDTITTALKAFVIASGIVLLAGTVLLGVLLYQRARPEPVAAPAAGGAIVLPAGTRIQQMVPDGRRLILLAVDPAGRQYLAVVNPLTGERLSLLPVEPER
ncbi:MAG TPA: hypothetical protein VFG47_23920 [Geminicoccaceae bacterium]|nr:hypothetical protein [Geminicoccaceae bacterium]